MYSNFESKQDLFAELFAQRSLDLAGRVLAEISGLDLAHAVVAAVRRSRPRSPLTRDGRCWYSSSVSRPAATRS